MSKREPENKIRFLFSAACSGRTSLLLLPKTQPCALLLDLSEAEGAELAVTLGEKTSLGRTETEGYLEGFSTVWGSKVLEYEELLR